MTIKRKLSRGYLEAHPHELWNASIDIAFNSAVDDLSEVQRQFSFALFYDAEVNNGGHLQFFENRGADDARSAIAALEIIGSPCLSSVLIEALDQWLSETREPVQSAEEYSEIALQGEFDRFDDAYAECEPSLGDLLDAFVSNNMLEFVELTD